MGAALLWREDRKLVISVPTVISAAVYVVHMSDIIGAAVVIIGNAAASMPSAMPAAVVKSPYSNLHLRIWRGGHRNK